MIKETIVERTWGTYKVVLDLPWAKVKLLIVNPHSASSYQKHNERSEHWFYANGNYKYIPIGEWHQLVNETDEPIEIIEVQLGNCREDDIERK